MTIDHDQNFKELISTFFLEFLELFLPEIARTIDPNSITFLQQEYFADLVEGEEKIIDLLVEVKQAGRDATFLVHIEAQASSQAHFHRRMFYYFARLHQRYVKDIYPIVIFSFDEPYRVEENTYKVAFPTRKVLEFSFESIQLNRLNWRRYVNQPNPVAAALMAKMKIAKKDRAKVKAECLRLLVTLRLNPAKTRLVSKFVDTYLRLNVKEEQRFQSEIDKMNPSQKEEIMQNLTSWEEKGMEKGMEKGRRSLVFLLLQQKVGQLPQLLSDRISTMSANQLEALAIALLNFSTIDDLTTWLDNQE
ncbi:Rpn family recombination-promoting nuclease/putative transposase [Phormidesmis sp. 146-20]